MNEHFFGDIERFNDLYKLENHTKPTLLPPERISQFHDILREEVDEGLEIFEKYKTWLGQGPVDYQHKQDLLTEMADWIGDLIVYCASEGRRWGLPMDRILDIIMKSNFSKLGADGQPIYDHRGKVMKGPHYWRPEERIKQLLAGSLQEANDEV